MVESDLFPRRPWKELPDRWGVFGLMLSNYMTDFEVADGDWVLRSKLESLRAKKDPVVVDIMSSTTAVRFMHKEGFKGNLIAVGVDEKRTTMEKLEDNARSITYIKGDLVNKNTWKQLEESLEGKKADLIMERGYGGMHFIPNRPLFYRYAMNRIWDMLDPEGGVAAIQTPSIGYLTNREVDLKSWLHELNESGIYNSYRSLSMSYDGSHRYGVLIMQKNPRAMELPDLPVAKVNNSHIA